MFTVGRIQLLRKVALGVPDEKFDVHFEEKKEPAYWWMRSGLNTADLQEISNRFLR